MLIGEHISLRRATPEDAELAASWWSDPEYRGDFYNVWPDVPFEWANFFGKEVEDPNKEGFYFIVRREGNEAVGTMGYLPYTVAWLRGLELWWQVHPSARRQGVATRAACLLINHLFDATPIERLQATVVLGNEGSGRVAEAAGMQLEGVHRRAYFLHGEYRDMHLYSIVREDWVDEKTYRKARRPF